jgi:Mlc titration factor MtfA (ptsG expression regulator)
MALNPQLQDIILMPMFRHWRSLREERLLDCHRIDDALWRRTLRDLPLLHGLSGAESDGLRRLTTLFLARKRFEPVLGLQLDQAMRLLIAVQACLPILNLDGEWYADWRTVIVYPGEFIRPRSEVDAAGVMHEWSEVLSGESWDRGPLVLSWADVEASGHCDGYNVVIHEMAHKLDALNGDTDGFPPLHPGMRASDWSRALRSAYESLVGALERNEAQPLDPYAAESPAEFFAVLSEAFFETPEHVKAVYPEVYGLLVAFYRQDPATRRASLT